MARKLGKGTLVYHDHNDDASYTLINQVESVTLPNEYDYNETDVTALADTTDQTVRGTQKVREVKMVLFWDTSDSGHTNIRTAAGVEAGVPWKIVTTDATPETWTFDAYVLMLGDATLDSKGAIKRSVTLRLTSDITIA